MITQAESGLSEAVYNRLLNIHTEQVLAPTYEVIAERYGFEWEQLATFDAGLDVISDVVITPSYIFVAGLSGATTCKVYRYTLSDGTKTLVRTSTTYAEPRLTYDGTTLTLFTISYHSDGTYRSPFSATHLRRIYVYQSTDNGDNWSAVSGLKWDIPGTQADYMALSGGTASAQTTNAGSAANVFAGGITDRWVSKSLTSAWIKYDLGSGRSVIPSKVMVTDSLASLTYARTVTYTIEGSNDNSSWTSLATSGTLDNWYSTTWNSAIATTTAYRYFRLTIASSNSLGADYLGATAFYIYARSTEGAGFLRTPTQYPLVDLYGGNYNASIHASATLTASSTDGVTTAPAATNVSGPGWKSQAITNGSAYDEWLKLDFGSGVTKRLNKLTCTFTGSTIMSDGGCVVEGSNDNTVWDTLCETFMQDPGNTNISVEWWNPNSYRYYRMHFFDTESAASNLYVQVYNLRVHESSSNALPNEPFVTNGGTYPISDIILSSNPLSSDSLGDLNVYIIESTGVQKVLPDPNNSAQTITTTLTQTDIVSLVDGRLYLIDSVDDTRTWNIRQNVRLQMIGDTYVVTAWSVSGSEHYPIEGYRYYTSKDGVIWSKGDLTYIPGSGGTGFKMLDPGVGDFIYGVEGQGLYRTHAFALCGRTSNYCVENLTGRILDTISFSNGSMSQIGFTLDNTDGWLDTHPWLNGEHRVLIKLKAGYHLDGETYPSMIPVGTFELDNIEYSDQLPSGQVRVTGRSLLSWMTDLEVAEGAEYWMEAVDAGDKFADNTDTDYGGLGQLAVIRGTWTSVDGKLKLARTKSGDSLAFSTLGGGSYVPGVNFENGQILVDMKVVNRLDKVGIVFRAVDDQNYWLFRFTPNSGLHEIVECRSGTKTVKASATPIAFTGKGISDTFTLVVEANYAELYCHINGSVAGGVSYTIDASTRPYGEPYERSVSAVPFDRGFVGLYAENAKNAIYFYNIRISDLNKPLSVYDVIRNYAAYAGVHDVVADSYYALSDNLNWTPYGALSGLTDVEISMATAQFCVATNTNGSYPAKNLFDDDDGNEWRTTTNSSVIDIPFKRENSVDWYASTGGLVLYITCTSSTGNAPENVYIGGDSFTGLSWSAGETKRWEGITSFGLGSIPTMQVTRAAGNIYLKDIMLKAILPTRPALVVQKNKPLLSSHQWSYTSTSEVTPVIAWDDADNGYAITRYGIQLFLFRYEDGYGHFVGELPDGILTGDVTVTFKEFISADGQEELWHSLGFFNTNGQQYKVVYKPEVGVTGSTYLGFSGAMTLSSDVTAIQVTHLNNFAENSTLDPGETAWSGLQRAIEGRYLKLLNRYDGTLRVWIAQPRTSQVNFTGTFNIQRVQITRDRRALKNHIRQVGAYTWAEYWDQSLPGHAFAEMNNPYLMNEGECYEQAVLSIRRSQEEYERIGMDAPWSPILEPEDVFTWNGQEWILTERSIAMNLVSAQDAIQGRRYIYGA